MNKASLHWQYALAKSELRICAKLRRNLSRAMTNYNKAKAAYVRCMTGQKPLRKRQADFTTWVCGIPCGVVIETCQPARSDNWGHPDNREPDQPEEVEFALLSQDGYEAVWLERKMDDDDRRQVEAECFYHRGFDCVQ